MRLILKKLDISVKEITFSDVDVFQAELVDQLENPSGDGGFSHGGDIGEGSSGGFVFQDDTVELRDVELIGAGA